MSTYIIGDVQGCAEELLQLLEVIAYEPGRDQLFFVGDLLNRGPHSLQVLRLLHSLSPQPTVVLGNHDLYLLSLWAGVISSTKDEGLNELLKAPDVDVLCEWLRQRPLIYVDEPNQWVMVHAGIPPCWDVPTAVQEARRVEEALRGPKYVKFLEKMYGDEPNEWDDALKGHKRLRYTTNALTRMRFCDKKGRLNLKQKGAPGTQSKGWVPWFQWPRQSEPWSIVFGHWAALDGRTDVADIYAVDTGCVWGRRLTALRWEDKRECSVPSQSSSLDK